jgi:hypothetical protein
MEGNSIIRAGFKERYRRPGKQERPTRSLEPFDGFARRSRRKGQRHLPFLHLQLPYTSDTLFDLLLGDIPIVRAQVRNNGNAPALMPFVELVTTPFLVFPGDPSPRWRSWSTMGVVSVGPLYPHQGRDVSVAWDWSKIQSPALPSERRFWLLFCAALCYDPVLDPRPNLAVFHPNQSPYHTKVVTIWSLSR